MASSRSLGGVGGAVEDRLAAWRSERVVQRLWARDSRLWPSEDGADVANRLGWLDLPTVGADHLDSFTSLADEVAAAGIDRVVLLGMGGSSLAPEVFQATFGSAAGRCRLRVLDSTHPAAVAGVAAGLEPERTLFVVSSKSGTTVETLSLFRFFWRLACEALAEPGKHFVAITDPGTPLEQLASDRRFRRLVLAPPDVGGRFSALSAFGLVPAALIGVDLERLLDGARAMAEACHHVADNPAAELGAALAELALAGRDKLTFLASPGLASLPDWLEQLIAESTGKDGLGIVPVVRERPGRPEAYGADRAFVALGLGGEAPTGPDLGALENAGHPVIATVAEGQEALGGELFRWEAAIALAGCALGIQPFDQPDVQLAKKLARRSMAGEAGAGGAPGVEVGDPGLAPVVERWRELARPGDYLAVQAFLAPTPELSRSLDGLRESLAAGGNLATTVGWGPRFLHSTGQLHKGGPDSGLFLQLVDCPSLELAVPETDYGFGRLIAAQADGDLAALRQRGRRVLRVDLGENAAAGLERLAALV